MPILKSMSIFWVGVKMIRKKIISRYFKCRVEQLICNKRHSSALSRFEIKMKRHCAVGVEIEAQVS